LGTETEMRVFVGTLYCGEGDFATSAKALVGQQDVDITCQVIDDLPEKEAHDTLWDAWADAKKDHDIFVKVDADTVLQHPRVLNDICDMFASDERLTGVQCWLHDYFTDSFIYGLNCYSCRVVFKHTDDNLFCDRVDTNHDRVLRGAALPKSLQPAGLHCHHANELQAFHFGLHRQLKGQGNILYNVRKAWERDNDILRAWALVGAHVANQFRTNRRFNYNDPEFKDAFEASKHLVGYV
jgi:hypothetical protein